MSQVIEHAFDIFDQYATDPNKELEGVWVPIGPATRIVDGVPDPESVPAIKVARSGNKRHGRLVLQMYEANESLLKLKNDAADLRGEEITIETMAKGILLGWKNVSLRGVGRLPDGWDIDNAKKLLSIKDFREMVNKHATNFELYKAVQEEAAAKN
jgi:hypothetical protein